MSREFEYSIDDVFAAIRSERSYQDDTWNADEDEHSIAEWLLYIQDHLDEARQVATRGPKEGQANESDLLRRIAALAVLAMEQTGAEVREGYEDADEECCDECECDEEVDDTIYSCPECGADVVRDGGDLVPYSEIEDAEDSEDGDTCDCEEGECHCDDVVTEDNT